MRGDHGCEKRLGARVLALKYGCCPRGPPSPPYPCNPEPLSGLPRNEQASATHLGGADLSPPSPTQGTEVLCLLLFTGTACFDLEKSADALAALPSRSVRVEVFLAPFAEKEAEPKPHIYPPYCEYCLGPFRQDREVPVRFSTLIPPQTHSISEELRGQ